MKAQLEPIVSASGNSFHARSFDQAMFDHPLHYHPEVELAYIKRSSGTLIVGDHIGSFGAGELYLLGSDLPHIFSQTEPPSKGAAAEVLQFRAGPSGDAFFSGMEGRAFRELLEQARLGLQFDSDTSNTAGKLMIEIRNASGLRRWAYFIELAERLMQVKPLRTFASLGYVSELATTRSDRIERVCQYILEHFKDDLSHLEVAKHFRMPPASFSRLFKKATRKTFQEFLNELRLGHACRQLADSDATVTEIAFASGFRNLSNFNRRFKQAYGCSPREYRHNAGAHTTPVD